MLHLQGAPMRRPFADWQAAVDRQLLQRIGRDSRAIGDWPWFAEYDCGTSPKEAVDEWIAENGSASIWL